MKQTIEISTTTILKIIAILILLVLLYLVKNILVMLFLAVILAAAVDTPIDWLVRHKIRRGFAVAFVYIFAIAVFALVIYLIIPPLASQVKILAVSLPGYVEQFEHLIINIGLPIGAYNTQQILTKIADVLNASAGNIFAATINIFGGIVSAILVLVISIYLAARERAVKKFVLLFVPENNQDYAAGLIDRIMFKLGAWMRGQIVLMAIIGFLVYIGLMILGIKFALTLALLTALLEIVPYIGPILSAVPGVIFALLQSLGLAFLTAAMYYVVQEFEKYAIVPFVMKRAVDLDPISVIIAVLVGYELYGIIGAVLAIPVAAMISIGFKDMLERRKTQN